jgi:hypothetical protein
MATTARLYQVPCRKLPHSSSPLFHHRHFRQHWMRASRPFNGANSLDLHAALQPKQSSPAKHAATSARSIQKPMEIRSKRNAAPP